MKGIYYQVILAYWHSTKTNITGRKAIVIIKGKIKKQHPYVRHLN